MATTDLPVFPQNPVISTAIVTGVDDLTSAPANTVLLATAGANGAEVSSVTAIPRATVTASSLHLFTSIDSGTTQIFLKGKQMPAHTVAATTEIPDTDFGYDETNTIVLAAGDQLYAGSAVALAGGIAFTAQRVDL
jgi:hypothetical protein